MTRDQVRRRRSKSGHHRDRRYVCALFLVIFSGYQFFLNSGIANAAGWTLAGPSNAPLTTAAFDASAPNVIVAARNKQVFASDDSGATWDFVAGLYITECGPAAPASIVTVAGAQGEQLTFNTCSLLYYSPDGEAWGRLSKGLLTGARLVSTSPTNQSQLYAYAGSPPTLVYSTNRLQTYTGIVFPGPTTLFYVDWAGGFIFSAVGGTAYRLPIGQIGPWQSFSTGLPPGTISGFAGGGAHLYVVTDSGVYRSANAGGLWLPSLPGSISTVAAGDGSNAVAYASNGNSVQKTVDGGVTWNLLPALPGVPVINSLVVAPGNPLQVVALTDRGLMQSNDGGQTFATARTSWQLPGYSAMGVVTNATRPAEIYVDDALIQYGGARSTDGGATWNYLYSVNPALPTMPRFALQPVWASGSNVLGRTISPDNGAFYLFRSADSGATWTNVLGYDTGTESPHSTELLADRNGTTLYFFNSSVQSTQVVEVYKSIDSGATWTDVGHFSGAMDVVRQRLDTGALFAGISGGLYRSTDGLLWSGFGSGLPSAKLIALSISATDSTTMYAGFDAQTGWPVYKSTDGGATWTPSAVGLPNGTAKSLAVDPATPSIVYVGFIEGGVYRSADGGVTWANISSGLYDTYINDLTFSLADPHRLFASTPSGLFAVDTVNGLPVSANAVEFYYPTFDHYFVTAFPAEIAALDNNVFPGWTRTGEAYAVEATPANGLNPVCRFFSATFAPKSSHFYTPYSAECSALEAGGVWQYEGIAFQERLRGIDGGCPGGFKPYYRLYNNGMGGAPSHRYSVKESIVTLMQGLGWVVEGAAETNAFACVPQ
jgi:photosystem II stability/assembly factor-like uncharacterized protein